MSLLQALVAVIVISLAGYSKGDTIKSINALYEACASDVGTCIKPDNSDACFEAKNCDYLVYVLAVDDGMFEISMTTLDPYEYVAVGFNDVNNTMSPAVVVECIKDGMIPRAFLSVNTVKHGHERHAETNSAFMEQSVVLENNKFLCQVMFHTAVTVADLTVDLANKEYYTLVAFGKLKADGSTMIDRHDGSKRFVSDNLIDYSAGSSFVVSAVLLLACTVIQRLW